MADAWIYPRKKEYQPYIHGFMEFFHGVSYPKNHRWTREGLLEITPLEVKMYLLFLAFGDPWPHDDARPEFQRSSSLEMAKKAISFFMPNNGPHWMDGIGGNPTKSKLVNDVIARVKKSEVRGQGADSKTKRALHTVEFLKTLELFRARPDWEHKFKYPLMALWQYHLIGRVDDVCHFRTTDPRSHPDFWFALLTKVRWSKNVSREDRCPDQILFGSGDPTYCIFIALVLYFEYYLNYFPNAEYLFTEKIPQGNNDAEREEDRDRIINNTIQRYRNRLDKVVWKHPEFKALLASSADNNKGIGTHSYRKHPSNKARGLGCQAQEIEIRGRWKTEGNRVVFRYIDVRQSYDDAKVAGVLCEGGPIAYRLRSTVTLTDDWLAANVVPHTAARFGHDRQLIRVLGLTLLWACMDEEMEESVPLSLKNRVSSAWYLSDQAINIGPNVNPVEKVPLVIYRVNDQVAVDLVEQLRGAEGQPLAPVRQGDVPPQAQGQQEQLNGLIVQMQQMNRNMLAMQAQLDASIADFRRWTVTQFSAVNAGVRQFGGTLQGGFVRQDPRQQAQRRQVENQAADNQDGPGSATLSQNPRTLMDLWTEYKFGIGGRKAAQNFTSQERNKRANGLKQKYYRRNIVWQTMDRLVRSGKTPQEASIMIRQVYGVRCSVTQIINKMIHDRKPHVHGERGHPNLR
jgi:hypothetical protein